MVKKAGEKRVALVNRGAWTAEEDEKLVDFVRTHGDKKWRTLPAKAGLNRCGKSCRLRWLNYLRPGIKRGNISEDEEDLIIRLHNLLGNRWSLIAGRLPGRTDNEIKNHWNTHLSKRSMTIDDLNSKLCQTPEGEDKSAVSHTTAAPSAPDPRESPAEPPSSEECSLPELDVDGVFPPLPEFDQRVGVDVLGVEDYSVACHDPCHSPSSMWFQSLAADGFGFDDLDSFLDYRDYYYLPNFI